MSDNKILLRYAGLATQFFIGIALTVFVGFKLDTWLSFKIPFLTWLLPLIIIFIIIAKIIKDTKPKN